jgi:isocitrate dehydrogenase
MANETAQNNDIIDLLKSVATANIDCIKTENLYSFDGKNDFTLSQGE